MIKLKNVNVIIGNKPILKNISCTIQSGDFIVIVGPNGAGKSTLFDVISGKRKPNSGTILFEGNDITHKDEKQRAPLISRLFQNPQLNGIASMTVAQNLALSTYKGKRARLKNGMDRFKNQQTTELNTLNLNNKKLLKTPMGNLSGGQRQLLAFLMATMEPPKLLLLDEPTAALDPQSATALLTFAVKFIKKHQLTTVLITHDPQLALTIGDKIWVLENGHITKQFDQNQKKSISAQDLIGHIDYEKITQTIST